MVAVCSHEVSVFSAAIFVLVSYLFVLLPLSQVFALWSVCATKLLGSAAALQPPRAAAIRKPLHAVPLAHPPLLPQPLSSALITTHTTTPCSMTKSSGRFERQRRDSDDCRGADSAAAASSARRTTQSTSRSSRWTTTMRSDSTLNCMCGLTLYCASGTVICV